MRFVLIGQAPSRKGRPGMALQRGPTTKKIVDLLGMEKERYLKCFERVNLLECFPGRREASKGDSFPRKEASQRARILKERYRGRSVLFVGIGVARVFGMKGGPLEWREVEPFRRAAILPHPSGLNRWWNEEENRDAARSFMADLGEDAWRAFQQL